MYLSRTIMVVGAVILVDNNRVLGINDDNVLEKNISNEAIARPRPRLHPHTVLSSGERCRFNCHVLHSGLLNIPP